MTEAKSGEGPSESKQKTMDRRDLLGLLGRGVVAVAVGTPIASALVACTNGPIVDKAIAEVKATVTSEAKREGAAKTAVAQKDATTIAPMKDAEKKRREAESNRLALEASIRLELVKLKQSPGNLEGVKFVGGDAKPLEKISVTIMEGVCLRRLPLAVEETKITPIIGPDGKPSDTLSPGCMPNGIQFEITMNEPQKGIRSVWLAIKPSDLRYFSSISLPVGAKTLTSSGENNQEYALFCVKEGDRSYATRNR